MDGDAVLRLVDEMNAVHRPFEKSKDEFHLPAVGIEQHDLKGGEVEPIGQEQEQRGAHAETDKPVCLPGRIIITDDKAVGDVPEEPLSSERDVHRAHRRHMIFQVRFHPKDEMGVRLHHIQEELEADVPPISDICHASAEHLSQRLTLTGFAGSDQDVKGNHAIQFKTQMQFDGLRGGCILGPLYGAQCGKERPINAVKHP